MTVRMPRPSINNDGMLNVLTGAGTYKDVTRANTYQADPLLDKSTLEALFAGDGLGRRIVEMPAEEALRQWFEIEGDDGDAISGDLEALDAAKHLTDALVWSRLFGGAGIIRLINDGGNLDDPLNRDSIRRVIGYRVTDRHRITWTTADLSQDANSEQFGQPEIYTVYPSNGVQYRVHHSRICIIDGMRLPSAVRDLNQGWGASTLQGAWSYLMRVGQNYGYTSNIMRDFVQAVLSVNGLTDMLANGQDDLVKKRINMLDLSRSVLNAMIIDGEGEAYQKQASSVAGIADLLDRHMEGLCAVTSPTIPMSKLVGRAPGGMNSSGDAEQRDYYDGLVAMRSSTVGKATETLVRDLYDARGGEPDQWRIKWNSLYQPTDAEQATTDKAVAETDNIYWQMGALDATEVRGKRFAELDAVADKRGDTYNADAARMPLYVSRKVLNVAEITAWAQSQGFMRVDPDLHVTVAYSREPVDWLAMGEAEAGLTIPAGGPRVIEVFGDDLRVMAFASSALAYRNRVMRDRGASWDYPEYTPHITISGGPMSPDVASIVPYAGPIVLGPEVFETINETA